MKKSIVLGLTATLLTFGPLVAGAKPQSKASKPASSVSQTVQKQQPSGTMGQTTQSTATTKTSNKAGMSSRIHKLSGTVDNISSDQLSITTKSGNKDTFALESSTKNATKPKAGDRVTVWYRDSNGQKTATRIAVNGSGAAANKSTKATATSAANSKAKSHSSMTAHH